MKQKTIQQDVVLKGRGLHFGKDTTLTIKPAEPNTGYVFKRIDLENQPIILAIADNVSDTSRGTTISQNGASVSTIEHLISSAFVLGIDNVLFELDGPEVPILDGSAKLIVEAINKVGTKEQDAELVIHEIKEPLFFKDDNKGTEISIFPDNSYKLNVLVDYNSQAIANQYAVLGDMSSFVEEIASSRTFVFLSELEQLLKLNLIKGGDLDNAIVIVDKEYTQEEFDRLSELFGKPSITVQSSGVLNNIKLQYANEPARHKLLDLIGDLALCGFRFNASVIAKRPGHFGNTSMAKIIRNYIKNSISNDIPSYNPDIVPLMDVVKVKEFLPHRDPFLFVDKVLSLTDKEVVGIKNVTNDEPYFRGHFPNEPVMPGVLIVEAMAQTGGILVLNTVPDPENYLTFFLKIDNVKFRKQVVPGDTLIMRLRLLEPIRRGIAHMKGEAYVGTNLATEAEMYAQILKQIDNK